MFYLYEVKIRLYYILLYFFFTWFCSYFFFNQFIFILTLPLKDIYLKNNPFSFFHLIFTEITEIFFSQTKFATYFTLLFFFPLFFYHVWLFIKPGLFLLEKKAIISLGFLSFCLTFFSLFITYFFLLPYTCQFFLNFDTFSGFPLYFEAKMDKYLSFILNLFLISYFFFQIPVFFFFFFN